MPRVAVVGVCGSGKSTVVERLRQLRFDAYAVGQEHSIVRDLWNHQRPDRVVYLQASLEAVRARRGAAWPGWIYELQLQRLADASRHACVVVDTGSCGIDETVERIVDRIGPMEDDRFAPLSPEHR